MSWQKLTHTRAGKDNIGRVYSTTHRRSALSGPSDKFGVSNNLWKRKSRGPDFVSNLYMNGGPLCSATNTYLVRKTERAGDQGSECSTYLPESLSCSRWDHLQFSHGCLLNMRSSEQRAEMYQCTKYGQLQVLRRFASAETRSFGPMRQSSLRV